MRFRVDTASLRFSHPGLSGVDFKLEAWEGIEQYHQVCENVIVISCRDGGLDPGQLQLQPAALVLDCHAGDRIMENARQIGGIVRQVSVDADEANQFLYTFHVVSGLWLLSQTVTSRIFQEMTSAEIIAEVISGYGITSEMRLKAPPRTRGYCVQFEESDLAFVKRLAEDDGYTFYTEQKEGKVIFIDNPGRLESARPMDTFRWDPGQGFAQSAPETITSFECRSRPGWRQSMVRDYNYCLPETDLTHAANGKKGVGGAYSYLAGHRLPPEGERIAQLRFDEVAAGDMVADVESDIRSAAAGCLFRLADFPVNEYNADYQIIRVEHHFQGRHYRNRFACIPAATAYRPPRATPRPIIPGLQTAVVVGQNGPSPEGNTAGDLFVDELGRIKVLFHWDLDRTRNERSSCWVRLMREYAGPGYGVWFLPRVGNEVLVGFLGGNPDCPVVIGSAHHAANMPPLPLPSSKTQNTLRMPSANELRFEDLEGAELVYINARRDYQRQVARCESISVGGSRSKSVAATETTTIGQGRTETVTEGGETITIKKGDRVLTVETGNYILHVDAGTITIYAAQRITLAVGASSIEMEPDVININSPWIRLNCLEPGPP